MSHVMSILRVGIPADSDIGYGVAPVVVATANGHENIVTLLMENGAHDVKIMVPRQWIKVSHSHYQLLIDTAISSSADTRGNTLLASFGITRTMASAPSTPTTPTSSSSVKFPKPSTSATNGHETKETSSTTSVTTLPSPTLSAMPSTTNGGGVAIKKGHGIWVLASVLGNGVADTESLGTTKLPTGSNLAAIRAHFAV
jgi:hypothetical protein